ncbi:MAG: peptidase M13, partial [Acidimicrobiales bacterium]|nr:peptidase M13 [Acidimicrobiales bacterium]
GIDLDHRDLDVRPQDDLFRAVSGQWLATAPIPDDRASDGAFHQLRDRAEKDVHALLQSLADAAHEPASEARKVGDLFASFLDRDRVNSLALSPLDADLAAVDAVPDTTELMRLIGALGRQGVPGPVGLAVFADAGQSDRYGAYLAQSGLGLPDESFYREDSFAPVRDAYVAHVTRILTLSSFEPARAEDAAARIMALETRLAAGHWDNVRDRDATATYNPHTRSELEALAPRIDWAAWLDGLKAPVGALDRVIVREPSFVSTLDETFGEVPLEDWKVWLRWHLLRATAALLDDAFVEADFDFYGRTLTGAPELKAAWKRGVGVVEGAMGEAVGRLYVDEHFPAEAKEQITELVANLIEAYRRSITSLAWMSEETRSRALEKLDSFTPKVGYPDRWRDYSMLQIDRDDLVGNVRRACEFEADRDLARIGQPVDTDEWFMSPQTVNAYYNPLMNEIVFPAAILQPPFFHPDADPAVNYGAIGAVIGHEIGHGFDDQGSRYDGNGNLNDWWTESDRTAFEERTAVLVSQYDALEPRQAPGQHVNGSFTLGENIGDLGGLAIAYAAYGIATDRSEPEVLDGLTGPQRFFWSWAQAWRSKSRDEEVARLLAIDPHSPPEFRCNAVVRNIDGFHEAFEVTEGDALWLAPEERVSIW